MFNRIDITFYDSFSHSEEVSSIKITQDNFTLMFAVSDEYEIPFINEIYIILMYILLMKNFKSYK